MKINIFILLQFICVSAFGQMSQKATFGSFLLKNATIVSVTSGTYTGDVHVKGNEIVAIGNNIKDNTATIIDCTGKYIYPGFVDSGTQMGLYEVGSIGLTKDAHEAGSYNPQLKALTAVNPSSVHIPITRLNGITTVLTKPTSGLIPGQAALINLFGYTPEQMSVGKEFLTINFPSAIKRGWWDKKTKEKREEEFNNKLKNLDKFWKKAKTYKELKSKSENLPYNPELNALIPVLDGKINIIINVNDKESILRAIEWVKEKNVDAIFAGVKEGYLVADSIAAANIPVLVGPVLSTPSRDYSSYDSNYKNPSILHQAGVKIAIQTLERDNVRNLPFHAGFAATYGLGIEEAIKAITINPCEIFGIDKNYGSIEVGKKANLFISDGDPFEMKTSIEYLFINGYNIPMESRQTLLNDEYLDRTPGLK